MVFHTNFVQMDSEQPIPLWIDCDPGQDDTVAIILACYSKFFNLLGISTVHGNVSLRNTTSNALRVLTAIGKSEIPVYPGEPKPLNGYRNVFAEDVHGKTGLNGSDLLPAPKSSAKEHNDFFPQLAATIEKYAGKICILAIGPLTNIALFFDQYPQLISKVKWLSVMGGGFKLSNITSNAEFNFYCDPFAAKRIFEEPLWSGKLILSPLDVTKTVYISKSIQSTILASDNKENASNFRLMMYELIDSTNKRMLARKLSDYKGPVVHDPVALVALLSFEGKTTQIPLSYDRECFNIGTEPGNYGSCMDAKEDANGVFVLKRIDINAFWNYVTSVYDICDKYAYMNSLTRDQLRKEFYNFELQSGNYKLL